jgi:hypothetical protein
VHTDTTAQAAPAHLYEVSGADFDGYPQIYVTAGDFADLHHTLAQLHPGTVNFRARRLTPDEAQRVATIPVDYLGDVEYLPRDHPVEIEYSLDGDQYVLEPFPLWKLAAALGHAESVEKLIDPRDLSDTHQDVTEGWRLMLRPTRPAKRVHLLTVDW